VIAPDLHYPAGSALGRHPESITGALDDERGHCHRVELREPALRRLAGPLRRLEGESKAQDGDGARRLRGATSDAGTERTPADDDGQSGELTGAKALEDGDPRGVELWRAGGGLAAGDTVGLLDQRDGKPLHLRCMRRCLEIRRFDSTSSPVAENESSTRLWRKLQLGACQPVRRIDLDNGHLTCITTL
jgi:hypothetical protein